MTLSRRELLKCAGLALFTPLIPIGTRPPQPVGKWILVTGETTPRVGGVGRWRAIRWRAGGLEMGTVVARAPGDPRLADERAVAGTATAIPPILSEWNDDGLVYRAYSDMGGMSVRLLWTDLGRPAGPPWNTLWAAIGEAFCAAGAAGVLARSGWRTREFVLTWEGRILLVPPVRPPVHDAEWVIIGHGLAELVGENPGNPFGGTEVLAAIERGLQRAPTLEAEELAAFVRGAAPDRFREELALREELRLLGAQQIVEIEATGT